MDVSKRFPRYWPFVRGIHPFAPVNMEVAVAGFVRFLSVYQYTNSILLLLYEGVLGVTSFADDDFKCISCHKTMYCDSIFTEICLGVPLTTIRHSSGQRLGTEQVTSHFPLQWRHNQITGATIICLTVCWGADQRKHQSASLAFVRGINRWPVDSPHKGPITRIMFSLYDVIILKELWTYAWRIYAFSELS